MRNLIVALLTGLLFFSCNQENLNPIEIPNGEEVSVKMSVSIPAVSAISRGSFEDENRINEILVLVQENNAFSYYTIGRYLESTGKIATFEARLRTNIEVVKLMIVANINSEIISNLPAIGDNEATIKESIIKAYTSAGIDKDFPMYGEYTFRDGLSSENPTKVEGVKMLRAIARADILMSDDLDNSKFELVNARIYRANSQIQVMPNSITNNKVISPSLVVGSSKSINYGPINISGRRTEMDLYLPESDSPTTDSGKQFDATCIVIGGKFRQQEISYYRIDFVDENNEKLGQVLRNRKYIFTIKDVLGPGWGSPDEAANAKSSAVVVEVKEWDEYDHDMVFDGSNYFGVSTRNLVMKYNSGLIEIIKVDTDVDDYSIQFCNQDGDPISLNSITLGQSMSDNNYNVSISGDGKKINVETKTLNETGVEKISYLLVSAKRLRIKITLTQNFRGDTITNVNVFNIFGYLGSLGGMGQIFQPHDSDARARALRLILSNTNHFGIGGHVDFGGFIIEGKKIGESITDRMLDMFDVIHLSYMGNGVISESRAELINNWLNASTNRVLFVHYDDVNFNKTVMDKIGAHDYYKSTKVSAYTVHQDAPEIILNGPFGQVDKNFRFRAYDTTHGEISLSNAKLYNITPILIGGDGGVVLGIDLKRGIVYSGDVDLQWGDPGSNVVGENQGAQCLTTGGFTNVNNTNDADKLIANLWSWIIDHVLSDN